MCLTPCGLHCFEAMRMAFQATVVGRGTAKLSHINGLSVKLPSVQVTTNGFEIDYNTLIDTQISTGDGICYLDGSLVRVALITGIAEGQGLKRIKGLQFAAINEVPQAAIDASDWDDTFYHKQELILTSTEVTVPLKDVVARRAIWTEKEYFRIYQRGRAKDDEYPESRQTCRVAEDVYYCGTQYKDGQLVLVKDDFLSSVLQNSPTLALEFDRIRQELRSTVRRMHHPDWRHARYVVRLSPDESGPGNLKFSVVRDVSRTYAQQLTASLGPPSKVSANGYRMVWNQFTDPKQLDELLSQPGLPWHTVQHADQQRVSKVTAEDMEHTEVVYDVSSRMLKVRFDYKRYNAAGEQLDADSDLDEEDVEPVSLDVYLRYGGSEYLLGTRNGVNPLVKLSDLRPTELLYLRNRPAAVPQLNWATWHLSSNFTVLGSRPESVKVQEAGFPELPSGHLKVVMLHGSTVPAGVEEYAAEEEPGTTGTLRRRSTVARRKIAGNLPTQLPFAAAGPVHDGAGSSQAAATAATAGVTTPRARTTASKRSLSAAAGTSPTPPRSNSRKRSSGAGCRQ